MFSSFGGGQSSNDDDEPQPSSPKSGSKRKPTKTVKRSPSAAQSDDSDGSDGSDGAGDFPGNSRQVQRRGSKGFNSQAVSQHSDDDDQGNGGNDPFGMHTDLLKHLHQHLGFNPADTKVNYQ